MVQVCSGLNHLKTLFVLRHRQQSRAAGAATVKTRVCDMRSGAGGGDCRANAAIIRSCIWASFPSTRWDIWRVFASAWVLFCRGLTIRQEEKKIYLVFWYPLWMSLTLGRPFTESVLVLTSLLCALSGLLDLIRQSHTKSMKERR